MREAKCEIYQKIEMGLPAIRVTLQDHELAAQIDFKACDRRAGKHIGGETSKTEWGRKSITLFEQPYVSIVHTCLYCGI